jgi:hypothetical protein
VWNKFDTLKLPKIYSLTPVPTRGVIGCGGGAIELWNAPYEGLCAHDYLIRNNVVNDTNQLDRTAAPIWIAAFGGGVTAEQCHSNIHIINNSFFVGPGSTFLFGQVENVTIEENDILRCETDQSQTVNVTDSSGIVFSADNKVEHISQSWICEK